MAAAGNLQLEIRDAFNKANPPDGSMKTFLGLSKLLEIFKQSDDSSRKLFSSEMVSLDFARLVFQYICTVRSTQHIKLVFTVVLNITKFSREFSKSAVDNRIHEMCALTLKAFCTFSQENLNKNLKQEDFHELSGSLLSVLLNIMRDYPECKPDLRGCSFEDTLRKLINAEDVLIKSLAALCLAYIASVDDKIDKELIALDKGHLEFLAQRVLPVTPHVKQDSHQRSDPSAFPESLRFSTEEILEPFAILVTNWKSGLELVKLGIISICQSVLIKASQTRLTSEDSSLSSAVKWSLVILYRLSKRPTICQLFNFEELMAKFSHHPKDDIAEIANGIISAMKASKDKTMAYSAQRENLHDANLIPGIESELAEGKEKRGDVKNAGATFQIEKQLQQIQIEFEDKPQNKNGEKHVMISYSHVQKKTVEKLVSELRRNGITNLWIDTENTHKFEGLVKAMVHAVDNSSSVICCISKAYSESENCMGELVYARDKKKTIIPVVVEENFVPDGELLFCIKADKLRFNISSDDDFNSNLKLLLQKIAPGQQNSA